MIDSLPSEHKIESIEGHQIRNEMETVMPFERTLVKYFIYLLYDIILFIFISK